jgi:hypothetical protein
MIAYAGPDMGHERASVRTVTLRIGCDVRNH